VYLGSNLTFSKIVRTGVLLVAAGSLTLLVSACASGSAADGPGSSKPVYGGTIYYDHYLEPQCLEGGSLQEAYTERQVADSLVSETSSGSVVPWLATSWTVSASNLVYTFHLKAGVTFSDGTPLNAEAVVKNFEWWLNPSTENGDVAALLGPVYQSSRATGPLTFQLTITRPDSQLLPVLAQAYDGILSPKSLARPASATCDDPIGSGPFIIQNWNHGEDVVFVRNPHYNSAPANALHQGPAYVSKLVWSFVADDTTRYGALASGSADVIGDVPTIDWQTAKSQFNEETVVAPGRPLTLILNTEHGVFTDLRVREAFGYAANREAVVQSAFNGEIPYDGNGALAQSTPDFDSSLENAFAYDPAKANELLDEAGWSKRDAAGYRTQDGRELDVKFVYSTASVDPEGATALQDLQQEWATAGFNVTLVPLTVAQAFSPQYLAPTGYDATISPWIANTPGVMSITYDNWRSPTADANGNKAFYTNPELTQLVSAAEATSDPAVARQDYDTAQEIAVNQATVLGLYVFTTSDAWTKNLHGFWIEASEGEPVFSDAYFAR
jgi:peptide/nickel transport system substrate-binding protein